MRTFKQLLVFLFGILLLASCRTTSDNEQLLLNEIAVLQDQVEELKEELDDSSPSSTTSPSADTARSILNTENIYSPLAPDQTTTAPPTTTLGIGSPVSITVPPTTTNEIKYSPGAIQLILTRSYPWLSYSQSTVVLQTFLGISSDGIYGASTQGAHRSTLRTYGLSTSFVTTAPVYDYSYTTPDFSSEFRTGAICADGWRSSATGSGACSWHGGVSTWLP